MPEIDCREDADVPLQGLLLMAHALFGLFCQKQHRFSIREQPMSRFCQAHRVRIAAQERAATFLLQRRQMTADRGLGQSEATRRRGNAPVLNNADEGAQQKEVVEDAYTVPG